MNKQLFVSLTLEQRRRIAAGLREWANETDPDTVPRVDSAIGAVLTMGAERARILTRAAQLLVLAVSFFTNEEDWPHAYEPLDGLCQTCGAPPGLHKRLSEAVALSRDLPADILESAL